MKRRILASIFFLSLSSLTHAQIVEDPDFDPLGKNAMLPRLIRVQVEFIEMPHTELTKLTSQPRSAANDTDLRKKCAELVKAGTARVFETMTATFNPGIKVSTHSGTEFTYPTEYEPAYLPENQSSEPQQSPVHPPTPTTFDTATLGSSLNVEAYIGEYDQIVVISIAAEMKSLVDYSDWGTWKSQDTEVSVKMPTFYDVSLKLGTVVIADQAQIISVISPKDSNGEIDRTKKLVVFLRAEILTVGR